MAERMPKNAVRGSLWVFDPMTEEEGTEVEAMPSGLVVQRSDDDRVLLSVRGRPNGKRYEPGDSVWLELEITETLRLIAELAQAVASDWKLPTMARVTTKTENEVRYGSDGAGSDV